MNKVYRILFNPTGKFDIPGPELVKECKSIYEAQEYIKEYNKKYGKLINGYFQITEGD